MNINLIKAYIKNNKIDWVLIPREDEFLGEYVPAYNERLLWATGFSGSAGLAFISSNEAHLFVDGRYTLQAHQQAKECQVHSLSSLWEWISHTIKPTEAIGINLRLHTQSFISKLQGLSLKIHHINPHPIDLLWSDRPIATPSFPTPHPLKYAGESHQSKLGRVIAALPKEVEALYVQDPHDVAWLLNMRGQDLEYTPLILGRALIWKNGAVDLFLNNAEITSELRTHLGSNVYVHSMPELEDYLLKPSSIQIDSNISAYDGHLVGNRGVMKNSLIPLMRAIKNSTEIEGMRKAHHWDGQALCKFRDWLLGQDPTNVDEISAAEQLEAFRAECPAYKGPSFPTISAFGPNGAIVHYRSTPETNQKFRENGLYLVDSGGQYLEGTTDVTRVFAIGTPTSEQKEMYTRILKGHLRLASTIFPKGTTGHQLDALARYDVWQRGLNYEHGTGHGVGSYLSVHEGPQGISPRINATPLQPGMVLSNEPGYYKSGEFGIRIENMMVVQESNYKGYLRFETLTQVPYEQTLIDASLLNDIERKYLCTSVL